MASRAVAKWGFIVAGAVGAIAVMITPLSLFGAPHWPIYRDPTRLALLSAAAAVAMTWNLAFNWLAFRQDDEFSQTASKFAWYWGGAVGLSASMPFCAFIAWGGLHWIAPSIAVGPDLLRAFVLGYCLPVVAQGVGFFVALAWWRASKR